MIHKKLLLTFIGLLSLSFQANAMKRIPSDDLIDPRLVKKSEAELKEKKRQFGNKRENTQTLLPTPAGVLLRSDEVADQQRMHEESLQYFSTLYTQFYQEYRRADEENGFLPNGYFVALARCKSQIPHNLIKQKRQFVQLTHWAEVLRAPVAPAVFVVHVAPVPHRAPEVSENEELITILGVGGINLNDD